MVPPKGTCGGALSSRVAAEPPVRLRGHPGGDDLLKRQIIHEPHEDLLVLIHALHEEILDQVLEHQFELVSGIHRRRLPQATVGHGSLDDLIEEELVSLVEVGAKALVHEVDQLRQQNGLRVDQPTAHLRRAVERPGVAIPQADRSLADLLQAVVL